MIQSHHILKDRSHQIHSELKFMDYTIPPPSREPNPSDLLWTEVHGWYNPTTFLRTEVIGSILNKSSRLIQSYQIIEYLNHRIHSEQKLKDDTILLRSRVPKSPDLFWTEVQGWYNPTTFLRTEVTGSVLNKCSGMIQSHHILEDRSHRIHSEQEFRDDKIPPNSQWPKSPGPF